MNTEKTLYNISQNTLETPKNYVEGEASSVKEIIQRKFNVSTESEKSRQVIIFDMDGTLYQLDGENNGYRESTLETTINKRMVDFISQNEGIPTQQAIKIFKQAISDPVGASQFLSQRYQISRIDYFNSVWNISPENIVKNYQDSIQTISSIPQQIKLILLSSAPRIWVNQVIDFLGIKDKFETIYSGEDFKLKTEIFQKISQLYQPKNVTSVGDQEKTDIQPAADLGFKTLLIKKPQDITSISY